MIAPARLSPGDDDTALEARAARHSRLAEIAGLHADGLSIAEAAAVVGVRASPDPESLPAKFGYMPSPATIAAKCRVIRATWTDADYRNRLVGPAVKQWHPPSIAVADLGAA